MVCVSLSVCMVWTTEREREGEADKRSRKPDQTWAQVTHRGYPVSIATGRWKTLGASFWSAEVKYLHAHRAHTHTMYTTTKTELSEWSIGVITQHKQTCVNMVSLILKMWLATAGPWLCWLTHTQILGKAWRIDDTEGWEEGETGVVKKGRGRGEGSGRRLRLKGKGSSGKGVLIRTLGVPYMMKRHRRGVLGWSWYCMVRRDRRNKGGKMVGELEESKGSGMQGLIQKYLRIWSNMLIVFLLCRV